jgi:ArsR family transcriptional regulator
MADIFDVVADPTRRDLMRLLLERRTIEADEPNGGELSVSQLVGGLALSQPTVSKHLKVLREAGLVSVRDQGQHRYYKLDFAPLVQIEDWLSPFLPPKPGADIAPVVDDGPAAALPSGGTPAPAGRPLPASQKAVAQSIGGVVASGLHGVRNVRKRLGRP